MVAGQTVMAGDPGAVENSEREGREPAHVNLVGGQAGGGADRIVVGELHVWQLRIPIILAFVDHHGHHLGHYVVNALHTTVTAWMVGAGGDFSNTKKLIFDVGNLGAELEAVVREDATWTPPKGNIPVDKDVGRAFSCKFSGGDGEHARKTAKASVKSKIYVLPRPVTGNNPKYSTLTAMPRPGGRGIKMTGHRTVSRGVFHAWHFKQWRNHQRVHVLIPIQQ